MAVGWSRTEREGIGGSADWLREMEGVRLLRAQIGESARALAEACSDWLGGARRRGTVGVGRLRRLATRARRAGGVAVSGGPRPGSPGTPTPDRRPWERYVLGGKQAGAGGAMRARCEHR